MTPASGGATATRASTAMATGDWSAVAARGTQPLALAGAVAALHGHAPATVLECHETAVAARAAWQALALTRLGRVTADAGPTTRERGHGAAAKGHPRATAVVGDAAWAAAGRAAQQWRAAGVRAAVVGDPAYPDRLATVFPLGAPPPWLAWRGDASALAGRPSVAVVGARRATSYGTGVAAWLARAAGAAGALVVSGGAIGIDAAAHEAALGTRGGTAVVLGCGHDVPYPRPHTGPGRLFERVVDTGGVVLSEVEPTEPAKPGRVLARNRIVAGLADVLVVVEGSGRSGTLRTATEAAERGVTVLAVPGDVRKPMSVAPNRLLTEGAAPVTCPDDLLAHLDLDAGARAPRERSQHLALPTALHAVLAGAWPRPRRVDQLVAGSRLPVGQVLAALTAARVDGSVVEAADGYRLATAPDSG